MKIALSIPSIYLLVLLVSTFLLYVGSSYVLSYAQESNNNNFDEFRQREFTEQGTAEVSDSNLDVEEVAAGLELPTTMAFLGPDDILVLEKEKGTVQRIIDGQIQPEPLLDVNVANKGERGMLGIAVANNETNLETKVFLYYTETADGDGTDTPAGDNIVCGCLYRYQLVNNTLVNPKLLLMLNVRPPVENRIPVHLGGKVIIGPDNNVYISIGDLGGRLTQATQGKWPPDGTGGILVTSQDGMPVNRILGSQFPTYFYYAYGIRNSYGMDFDPVTGNMWDTENGPNNSDEINLVLPGFNSGWKQVMGLAVDEEDNDAFNPDNIVDFDGKGSYSDPELVWRNTVGPTALIFLHSDKLGSQYQNDMFVGDVHGSRLYHFKLNEERTDLILPESHAASRVIETPQESELSGIVLGEGFGGITDLEVGPDGYLYIVSIYQGKIFKVVPAGER